jgi:RND family efflux transporter MFP subunit
MRARLTMLVAGAAMVALATHAVRAADLEVHPVERIEFKAVYGSVEARDTSAARARIGGTIVSLAVEEGSAVAAGDVIATVVDDKLALQRDAFDARLKALDAQLQKATADLARGKSLFASGTIPQSKLDELQSIVDVLANQISAAQSDRAVIEQQAAEGEVLAPAPGRVLTVPVTRGSVVMPGDTIARIASGGYFLRLSLPERHAAHIHVGDAVQVGERGLDSAASQDGAVRQGRLVKVYPEISGGRILADVEVDGLGDYFVGERTLVWIPVDRRMVIAVPPAAVSTRYGVDYVELVGGEAVAVVTGESFDGPGGARIEILSGVHDGDKVVVP